MPEHQSGQVTELLRHWKQGDEKALDVLVPLVYKELRRLAHYHLQSERPDHTLQSTALVHEAYLRLLGGQPVELQNRAHFIAVASRLMRQILVDYARERRASKRDGGCRMAFEYLDALPVHGDVELLALDDALDELSRVDERQGKIVEMKFFGGLSAPEISQVLGISRATVDRDWATARVWLHRQMSRTDMTTQPWEHVKELLHHAMQLVPEQRARFLDEACSSDAALRAEVESLLLADEGVRSSFLQSPPVADGLGADYANKGRIDAACALEAGQVFAQRFQLVRKLGEGGMGQVWLAEQTSPVRRQVALKLIKAGMYDEAVVQRFQSERQSLAIMDHPAIAKVFDAGTTPQGQPYFVMEYVPGLPITEYCDQRKLSIRDRLGLFIQACEGVQHAHQKAIIHRDLKPANILVVEVDGKPVPRIIDFGLAKATIPQVTGESPLTQLGHFVGTPGYMSPEQADPNVQDGVHDIDTRTDVYSLGVVLYMLLTGLQPLDTRHWKNQPLDELLRKLREEEPPSPSAKVSTDRDTSAATAEARGTEPKQLVSLLRGDLDCITMKAHGKRPLSSVWRAFRAGR